MKTNIYITFISFILLSLSACTLERESFNEIYPENFYRNEEDVNKALAGLYRLSFRAGESGLYGHSDYSYWIVSDITAGTVGSRDMDSKYADYTKHRWEENMTSGMVKSFTESMYGHYNRLTGIRETIKRIEAAPISDALKTKAIAEAKVLYGWIGFIMYDLFGPVPLATDEALANPDAQIYIPRLSDQEYTDIMIGYLDEAITAGLPIRQDNDWGRASKALALMIKLKFHMLNKNFTEAETVARELYACRGKEFDLLPKGEYANIFNKTYARNKEIIHAIPCGLSVSGMENMAIICWWPVRYSKERQCWGMFGVDWNLYDTYEAGDDRLNCMLTSYTSTSGENISRGVSFFKFQAALLKVDDPTYSGGNFASVDQIVFRFADVMLSLAECINENNGGPTKEAIGLVNEIRNRVNLPELTDTQTADKKSFNETILMERLHEFIGEGLSRQDKIRHGGLCF